MPRSPLSQAPAVPTAPVLAVLVCHDGEDWLPRVLSALRHSTIRPRHVLAVDTGSADATAGLLAEAAGLDESGLDEPEQDDSGHGAGRHAAPAILDGVLTLSRDTGFAEAVAQAVEEAQDRWGDPGAWIWVLHDDSAPEPDCLDLLLRAAETAPSAAVLGPLAVDWTDERLVVEAGLATDASGHRQHAPLRTVGDDGEPTEQTAEVLAMPSAGSLLRRTTWDELGGFDRGIPLLREDIDYGWRVNAAGGLVLCVPSARVRHVRATTAGLRDPGATGPTVAAADRRYGLRTFLTNCSTASYVLGLPRLFVLCVLRGIGFALTRDGQRAGAEFAAAGYLVGARKRLRAARAARAARAERASVRGLVIGRFTRLRNAARRAVRRLVGRKVAGDVALGRLPEPADADTAWLPSEGRHGRARPVGPDALPAGALRGVRHRADIMAVPLPARGDGAPADNGEPAAPRPSPGRVAERELVFVAVDRRRILAATLFAPPVVLLVVLTALGLVVNGGRLGADLAGGALLPVGGLGEVWSTYLAAWHGVGGGTASAAPMALPVLGVLGAPFAPVGGPPTLVAVLLLGELPLAALLAYAAMRRVRICRWVKAGMAAAYALLPAAGASVSHGRLDVVVVHLLLPALIAGLTALLTRPGARWLSTSVLGALGLAVLAAFSPLAFGLALVAVVAAFVLLPSPGDRPWRGAPAVAIVVLLPLLLLLPWLPTLWTNPALLLHGIAGPAPGPTAVVDLLALDPVGDGVPFGFAVVVAALVTALARPTSRMVPGLVMTVLGIGGVLAVQLVAVAPVRGGPQAPGYAGVPLLVVGTGLLLVLLGAVVAGAPATGTVSGRLASPRVAGAVVLVAVLVAGAAGAVVGRDGPLRADAASFAPSLAAELARTGQGALVLGADGEPPRLVAGRLPAYGDDALALVDGAAQRLSRWQRDLVAGSEQALTSAAAAGVRFVVLPPGEAGDRLRAAAPELIVDASATSDGRAVLRLASAAAPVVVVSPEQANRAVTGKAPSGELLGGESVAKVDARLPDVRVRVSDGPAGRLLVLTAEHEAGWRASVNGDQVPIVPAWGHQVAVSVPTRQAEIAVEFAPGALNVLLLGQVAALLFTLLTAIPGRRRELPTAPS